MADYGVYVGRLRMIDIEREVMRFRVVLAPDETGGYNVSCPALRGCRSQGDTLEEALDNIADAIQLYFETASELASQQAGQIVRVVQVPVAV